MELIIEGRYYDAEVPPPRYSAGDWVQLARYYILNGPRARPRLCCNPLHTAVRWGFRVIDEVPTGAPGECCDGSVIRHRQLADPRALGLSVVHGLAHCCFVRAKWLNHTEADAWGLAGELMLPSEVAPWLIHMEDAKSAQKHAPGWFLAAQIRAVLSRRRAA